MFNQCYFAGSKTGDAESSGSRFELPLESYQCRRSCLSCSTVRISLVEIIQIERLNTKHFHYTSTTNPAAAATAAIAEHETRTKSQFERPKESICYL
jgi:hypothetical protein